jgi:hypothetical protein
MKSSIHEVLDGVAQPPLASMPFSDLYTTEERFESGLIEILPEVIEMHCGVRSMVLARQMDLKTTAGKGRNATLDVLMLDEQGRLVVVENKIKASRSSTSQADVYVGLLEEYFTHEMLVEAHVKYSGLDYDDAEEQLASFCGHNMESDLAFEVQIDEPAIVVFTTEMTSSEYAHAKRLARRGVDVHIVLASAVPGPRGARLSLMRGFPSGDPKNAVRVPVKVVADGDDHEAQPLMGALNKTLSHLFNSGGSSNKTGLRIGAKVGVAFEAVLKSLENEGLISVEKVSNGKKGRDPEIVTLTEKGYELFQEDDTDDEAGAQPESSHVSAAVQVLEPARA